MPTTVRTRAVVAGAAIVSAALALPVATSQAATTPTPVPTSTQPLPGPTQPVPTGSPTPPVPSTTAPTPVPPAPTAAPSPVNHATSARLVGRDRYETAVLLSRTQYPKGARLVVLVNGTSTADAIAAGNLTGGPVLLVPGNRPVPASVLAEIRRLAPRQVVAVGGTGAVPAARLREAAQGRPTQRVSGPDRYATAVAASRYGVPRPVGNDNRLYFATSTATTDGLLAGVAASPSREPVLLLPRTGRAPDVVRKEVARLHATYGQAVGRDAVSEATVKDALGPHGIPSSFGGVDVYETSDWLAEEWMYRTLSGRVDTLYLAATPADLLAAGTLEAPVMYVPTNGPMSMFMAEDIRVLAPRRVVALGPSVPVSMLRSAQNAVEARLPQRDESWPTPYFSKDHPVPGVTFVKKAGTSPEMSCTNPSTAGVEAGTYTCTSLARPAVTRFACVPKPGYPDVVTCIVGDWWGRIPADEPLAEYRVRAPLPKTRALTTKEAVPLAVALADGRDSLTGGHCQRFEVPVVSRDGRSAWAACDGGSYLWSLPGTHVPALNVDGSTVQYLHGTASGPLTWSDVEERIYLRVHV